MPPCADHPTPRLTSAFASLVLHGLGVFCIALLAAWQMWFSPVKIEKPTPPKAEPGIVINLAALVKQVRPEEARPLPAPKRPEKAFIPAASEGRSDPPPDSKFFSSVNMRAASAKHPEVGADVSRPNQDGVDLPLLSVRDENFRHGSLDLPPVPVPPTPPPSPPEEVADRPPEPRPPRPPEPTGPGRPALPAAPVVAVARPVPPKSVPRRSPPTAPAPRPMQPRPAAPRAVVGSERTRSTGAAPRREGEGVDAESTPAGKYGQLIYERIGLLWKTRLSGISGLAGMGVVEVEFDIDAKGAVSNVKLMDPGGAPSVLEDACLSAVTKARLPPPPEELQVELRDRLSGGLLRRKFTFFRL